MNVGRTRATVVGTALAGAAGLALISPASPALAFLSGGLHLDVTVQSPATLVARGAAVDVPVDVDCNSAQQVELSLTVTERVGSQTASGSTFVPESCSGGHQRFLIRVTAGSGKAFAKGTAVATASIFGCNNTTCGQDSNSATIQVRK